MKMKQQTDLLKVNKGRTIGRVKSNRPLNLSYLPVKEKLLNINFME